MEVDTTVKRRRRGQLRALLLGQFLLSSGEYAAEMENYWVGLAGRCPLLAGRHAKAGGAVVGAVANLVG